METPKHAFEVSYFPKKVVLYKKRFYMLFLFCLCNMITTCGWICFATLTTVIIEVRIDLITFRLMESAYS